MKVQDIYSFLDEQYDFSAACDFDNCGLLIGDKNAEVTKAIIALDCVSDTIDFAIENGANLIITHHPIIFGGIKSVTSDTAVYKAIVNGISVICAHTNLDTADGGVNDTLCEILDFKNIEKYVCADGFVIRKAVLPYPMTAQELSQYACERLGTNARFTDNGSKIQTVAVCSGAGSDMMYDAINSGADAYISSEIKHNIFIEAYEKSFNCIDLGHFATEKVIVPKLCGVISASFPELQVIPFEKKIINYT